MSGAILLCSILSLAAVVVTAQGPISAADCMIVNPAPESQLPVCSSYPAPTVDVLRNLPYGTVTEYGLCVRQRCVCNGQKTSLTGWTPNSILCGTDWDESGYISCNQMVDCFKDFWHCTIDAVMDRNNNGVSLSTAETQLVTDILSHGSTPGQPFSETDVFKSCSLAMCEAAASRKNCGLRTCYPNNTQCFEYIVPPPLPYGHQICTQGCRAGLILMALTLAMVALALACCGCCPAQYKVKQPLIVGEEASKKRKSRRRRDSDAPDSNFDVSEDGNDQPNAHTTETHGG